MDWFRRWRSRAAAGAGLIVLVLAGCQQTPPTPSCQGDDCDDVEPNGSFLRARAVELGTADAAIVTGTISLTFDIDVFDLGPASAGDLLEATLRRQSTDLLGALALYDGAGDLINEDTITSLLDETQAPRIVHTVRLDTPHLYIAATSAIERNGGNYEIEFRFTRGGDAPAPRRQIAWLNFEGGRFEDDLFGTVRVGAFDAADIDAAYAGQTAAMREIIEAVVREGYGRFDVTILSSTTDETPAAGTYSEVLFGGFSTLAFGASENVDLYNVALDDRAIVFAESFEPDLFGSNVSAEEMAIALGNVAAHELGHLLGLNHVNDATDLMDESSPAFTLLDVQIFKRSPLAEAIFPLGHQDGVNLLDVIVGTAPSGRFDSRFAEVLAKVRRTSEPWIVPGAPAKCLTCLRRETLAAKAAQKIMPEGDVP